MRYNTEEKRLTLPEYGRNIQNMIDHCVAIPDREERKRCANAIIQIMGNLFPHLRDVNDFKHILWDHLAIMSDFKLDIDYPYEIVKKENLYKRPQRIPYSNYRIHYRHYGEVTEQMVRKAMAMEAGTGRDHLTRMLANQMKRALMTHSKEVDDRRIFKDLAEMSNNTILIEEGEMKLLDARELKNRGQGGQGNNGGSKRKHKR